jgi:hypothetical protein
VICQIAEVESRNEFEIAAAQERSKYLQSSLEGMTMAYESLMIQV